MAVARLVTRLGPLSVIDAVKHHGAPVLERICVDFPAVAQAGFLLFGKLVLDGRCRAEKASAVDMAVLLNRVDHLRILLGHGALITIGPLAGPHQGPVPTLHLVLDFCHVTGFSQSRQAPGRRHHHHGRGAPTRAIRLARLWSRRGGAWRTQPVFHPPPSWPSLTMARRSRRLLCGRAPIIQRGWMRWSRRWIRGARRDHQRPRLYCRPVHIP